jgi:DNA-directed RNA polymerase subunit L
MEVKNVDFAVLDALQEILNKFEEVEYAGANVTHPLLNTIHFVLRTKKGYDVVKTLKRGLEELMKVSVELRESLTALQER